jgi:Domain of unknown function (DUF1843)/Domain of unknown function (DUF1842)
MPTAFLLKRITGTAGNVGLPGAPILYFDLLYNTSTGAVSGHACIVSAVPPPFGNIVISNVTGKVTTAIFGGTVSHIVTLQGSYQISIQDPPLIIEQKFSASFQVDSNFDGRGSFDYGGNIVNDVPVTSTVASSGGIQQLYGVVIHGAIASGDQARMKEVAAAADKYLAQVPEVQKALNDLKAQMGNG